MFFSETVSVSVLEVRGTRFSCDVNGFQVCSGIFYKRGKAFTISERSYYGVYNLSLDGEYLGTLNECEILRVKEWIGKHGAGSVA